MLGAANSSRWSASCPARIEQVPGAALPPGLRWLILTDNRIEQLPPEIGRCSRLQKLALAGNRLQALPAEMAACQSPGAAAHLGQPPDRATCLGCMSWPRLTWLAHAWNPCCLEQEQAALAQSPIAAIALQDLQLQQVLGAGRLGVIHPGQQRQADSARPVAVKLFRGEASPATACRNPRWPACLSGGDHPQLIPRPWVGHRRPSASQARAW